MIGNSVGTLWERFGELYGNASGTFMGTLLWTLGMLWELCRNSMGTLWELCRNTELCIPYFTFIEFWILSLCCIICCTNTILYNMLYIHYIALYPHMVQYPCIIHYNAKWTTWANTLLLYSPSASPLTMIMGQSFPRWEHCWEHWSNVFYLNVAFGLQNVFQASTLLMNIAISLKRC
jgi:hypothetical protein